MAAVEVETADVLKLMMQFLRENRLLRTLEVLQDETAVSMNTVESLEGFVGEIATGRWDAVLRQLESLKIPVDKLIDVHEQIVRELAELRDVDTAKELLKSSAPLRYMRQTAPERFVQLERLVRAPTFDPRDAYPDGSTKEQKRADIASALAEEVAVVPPRRLQTLLSQALKWQKYTGRLPPGARFDLFRGTPPRRMDEDDAACVTPAGKVKFGTSSRALCVQFSPDGEHIITGSNDGFVEVWDSMSGDLDSRLAYQARDELMMHDDAVLSIAMTDDMLLLATGCRDGGVKVWELATGSCLQRFAEVHPGGVSSLCFSREGSQLLSGGNDGVARILGLQSGRPLKEFRGHSSFVTRALFSPDNGQVVTASADGSIKVWSTTTSECITTFRPPQALSTADAPILAIAFLPHHSGEIVVLPRGRSVFVMNLVGHVVREVASPGGTLSGMSVSPRGKLLHTVGDDLQLRCFDLSTGVEVAATAAAEAGELFGVYQHPRRNVVVTSGSDGRVSMWSKRGLPSRRSANLSSSTAATAMSASAAAALPVVESGVAITSGDTL
jgi:WD40 repeat-containing protein SMU1